MFRPIATLLLMAHVAAFAAPALAEARTRQAVPVSHCVPTVVHFDLAVTPASESCDACEMPDCLGTASCAHASVAIVSISSIDFAPSGELATSLAGTRDAANLLHTPLPPPPKP
jgi:hypothetical protein